MSPDQQNPFNNTEPTREMMKTKRTPLIAQLAALLLVFAWAGVSRAQTRFSDNFQTAASSMWGNERGNWIATGTVYNSQAPTNTPPTYTSLPYDLTDFTLDLDINGVSDGGVWLHADASGQNGVLLITGGNGWGGGVSSSIAGTSLYWHVVTNGVLSTAQQEVDNVFTPGQNVHLTVVVSGNTYQAYLNGTLQTSFTDSTYTHGRVGLYDFSPASAQNQTINQTFDNVVLTAPPSTFFTGQVALANGVDYLSFPANGNLFGYYSYLSDPRYIYHFDLGYEYVFDAADGHEGVYFYDFKSQDYFYTSPTFSFPYLYDFGLNAVLYYYPDPNNPGRYNTNGVRYFYRFDTGQIITK